MRPDFWPRMLVTLLLLVPFSFWLERRGFVKWERAVLMFVFVMGVGVVWDALRGHLP